MNPMPVPAAIHLHIDQLVLRGFSPINEAALSAALQEALSRELSSSPALRDAHWSNARATISLPAHYDAHTLGTALAQSLTKIASPDEAATRKERHG